MAIPPPLWWLRLKLALYPSSRASRQQSICDAFDAVLAGPQAKLTDNLATGRRAVILTDNACGPTAHKVLQQLRNKGFSGFKFHSLHGHYVVRDQLTNLVYDLETYAGLPIALVHQLPVAQRHQLRAAGEVDKDAILGYFAARWLAQRADARRGVAHVERTGHD